MSARLVIVILVGLALAGLALFGLSRPRDVARVAPQELAALLGKPGVTLIDVRIETDWDASQEKIPGAVRESPRRVQVEQWAKRYPKDGAIVLYCA